MKTLAARIVMSERAKKAMTIAAVAAPMVLLECGGAVKNDVPATPVVVIDAPLKQSHERDECAPARETQKQPAPRRQSATALNANIYPGCVIEARLSVINPDNSLEKVILDPKVEFSAEIHPSSGTNRNQIYGRRLGLCSGVPECDISEYVRAALPFLHLQNDQEARVFVSFAPTPGSKLAPSEITLQITHDELVSYCH